MSAKFPKALRLRTRREFKRLHHPSRRFAGRWIAIDCRSNNLTVTRLGITVTKRYGKSHVRNRFKRVTREAFRLCHSQLPSGFDLNVKPRSDSYNAKPQDIIVEFQQMFLLKDES